MNFENAVYNFIKVLTQFDYRIESIDHIWDIIFPDQKEKYHYIRVTKYHEVFYITQMDGDLCTLEVTPQKSVQVTESGLSSFETGRHDPAAAWNNLIVSACRWLEIVKKDWIKAGKKVHESYPLNRRFGVPNSLIRSLVSDIYRIDKELGKAKTKKFINLVEGNYFHDKKKTTRQAMTANDFFDYCQIAYIAGKRKDDSVDETLSGREMYKCYADGRHEGLLDIDPTSEKEFANWIDKRGGVGHPWEIKRGGNTTHIDLYVTRPSYYKEEEFEIVLSGRSIGRLKETICMFLGIYDAGLPISISDPEGIRKRLLAQDNIGFVPCFASLHRANQRFPRHQDVYDVLR